MGGIDPEGTETELPSLGQQAASSVPSCPMLEDEEAEVFPEVRELWRAGVCEVGGLSSCPPVGMRCNPLPTSPLRACLCLWSVSVTVSPPLFGQESQWLHFLPSVCPSDSLPVCLHLALPLPPPSVSLSDSLSVCLCLLLRESLSSGTGVYWGCVEVSGGIRVQRKQIQGTGLGAGLSQGG